MNRTGEEMEFHACLDKMGMNQALSWFGNWLYLRSQQFVKDFGEDSRISNDVLNTAIEMQTLRSSLGR